MKDVKRQLPRLTVGRKICSLLRVKVDMRAPTSVNSEREITVYYGFHEGLQGVRGFQLSMDALKPLTVSNKLT